MSGFHSFVEAGFDGLARDRWEILAKKAQKFGFLGPK
jgi:hypothetical protein